MFSALREQMSIKYFLYFVGMILITSCGQTAPPVAPDPTPSPQSNYYPTDPNAQLGGGNLYGQTGGTTYTGGNTNTGGSSGTSSQGVQMVLQNNCLSCHGNFSYAMLIQSGDVVPGNAQASKLCTYVYSGQMPKGGTHLSPADVNTICSWIQSGAPE